MRPGRTGYFRCVSSTVRVQPRRVRAAAPGFTDERVMVMARGAVGELWVGTRNGLNRFDPRSGELMRDINLLEWIIVEAVQEAEQDEFVVAGAPLTVT